MFESAALETLDGRRVVFKTGDKVFVPDPNAPESLEQHQTIETVVFSLKHGYSVVKTNRLILPLSCYGMTWCLESDDQAVIDRVIENSKKPWGSGKE